LISTTLLGLLAAIWPASAAETPSIQLKPQSTITALDAIADQTHGAQRARLLAATQKGNSREALGGEFDTATVLRDS
jgi:hypothetical protein